MDCDSKHTFRPTTFLDWHHSTVGEFVARHADRRLPPKQQVVALYLAVRDTIRYDPYRIDLSEVGMRASTTIANGYGWCVPKAVLLAACCRAIGVAARLGFGDVKNHLTSERLRRRMQTDTFYWHGFTEMYLDGRWLKATPAFNREWCERLGIAPLEFDGEHDSVLHPCDAGGKKFMEYLKYRGSYSDLPLAEIVATFARYYPALSSPCSGDFHQDAITGEER